MRGRLRGDEVAGLRSEEGRDGYGEADQDDVGVQAPVEPTGGGEPGREQQGVTRQEEAEQQPGLGEHDEQRDRQAGEMSSCLPSRTAGRA